jgi:signal transduction histidine kinase
MKTKNFPLFSRVLVWVFTLITVLSLLFIFITYFSAIRFYQASTQLLNRDVAAHIAKFTSPFEKEGLNRRKADSVFYQAMVISPSIEVYFLDTNGKVIYYHGSADEIKLSAVPLANIREYINSGGNSYVKGDDPRDPSDPKIFSAAAVLGKSGKLGYIYVILGSKEYRNVTQMFYRSHAGGLLLKIFSIILLTTILLTLLYVNRLQRNFNNLISVLKKFESGDLDARFPENDKGDLGPVTKAFNKMAGLLLINIDKLKKAEVERKDFTTNISHDLRTPLAIARGYAETLFLNLETNNVSHSEKAAYSKLVISNIQIVEHMVQQLLDLSKMESAGLNLEKQPFIFSEIVQEFVHSFALTAFDKKIVINCSNCENASWISADIHMMERVVQNLLMNAIKYTPENKCIHISLENQSGELVFQITNNGASMTGSLTEWLNDNKTDSSNKRPQGRGLGLVIVKTILQIHRFSMYAGFKNDVGNIISFRMPVTNPAYTK